MSSKLKLYDTARRETSEFVPIAEGKASIYVCGATVQAAPHVGHIRSGVNFDILRRWLEASGLETTFIRNVTDIDDKIIHNAGHEDITWWELAARYEKEFTWAHEQLGNLTPTIEPRATGHIPQMFEIIQTLIDKNHAYVAQGSVWFSVRSFKEYGSLSGQKIDEMLTAQDPEKGKKDPHDFALWKASKDGEPFWNSPWGPGRPGWHIECSAMAQAYLGNQFDIHGGGLDLAFPHHENEVAQSKAAGQKFANYWLHNYWVTQSGEKMSKSLGNTMKVSEILSRFRAIDVRFYLLSAHYRSNLEFSDQALSDAATAFSRIEQFVVRSNEKVGSVELAKTLPPAFQEALDEDLATPSAFAVIHEFVTNGNTSLANDAADLKEIYVQVRTMLNILGLDPLNKQWQKETSQDANNALDSLIQTMLKQRNDARAAKNFAVADSVRDALNSAGILIEDTPQGSRWSINKESK